MAWAIFWKYFFWAIVIGYSILAVYITITGFKDIVDLLAHLKNQENENSDKPKHP